MDTIENYTTHRTYTRFRCPGCGEYVNSDLEQAGKPDQCPDCRTTFIAPGESELVAKQAEKLNRDIGREMAKESRAKVKEARAAEKRRRQYEREQSKRQKQIVKQQDREALIAKYQETLNAIGPPSKNKGTASVLAILLGTFGVQFFYLDEPIPGIACLLFFWTGIPTLIGICHGIALAFQSHEQWDYEYQPSYNREFHRLVAEHRQMQGLPAKPRDTFAISLIAFGAIMAVIWLLAAVLGPKDDFGKMEPARVRYSGTVGFERRSDLDIYMDRAVLGTGHESFASSAIIKGEAVRVPSGSYKVLQETTAAGPVKIRLGYRELWIASR